MGFGLGEHTWEEEEDIYSSLEALDITVRFLQRGKYYNGIHEIVIKDIDGKVSGVTIRLLDGDNTMKTYNLHAKF